MNKLVRSATVVVMILSGAFLCAEDAATPDVSKLIAALDSADFDQRDAAFKSLSSLTVEALPILKEKLAYLEKAGSVEPTKLLKAAIFGIRQTAFKKELEPALKAKTEYRDGIEAAMAEEVAKAKSRMESLDAELPEVNSRICNLRKELDENPKDKALEEKIAALYALKDKMFNELNEARRRYAGFPGEILKRKRYTGMEISILNALLKSDAIPEEIIDTVAPAKVQDWCMTPAGLNFALNHRITCEFVDTPIDEALNFASNVALFPVAGKDLESRACNLKVQNVTIKSLLDELCKQGNAKLVIDSEHSQILLVGQPLEAGK